jgi:drug/metabolite transporter (DMT)-like permease
VARLGTFGLEPVELLFWASLIGAACSLPLAVATGTFVAPRWPAEWGAPDRAILALASIHAVVYTTYVWLLGRAGAVFTAQVGYLVTGFGVLWAILFLDESYSAAVWLALALILSGIFLVQPRAPGEVAGPA